MQPWWITVLATIITAAFAGMTSVAVCAHYFGKLEQKVNDNQASNEQRFSGIDRNFARHEENERELYALGRKHEDDDQKHFGDTDMHWNKREREWLGVRFENQEKRFDTLDKRFDAQDKNLIELLRRTEK